MHDQQNEYFQNSSARNILMDMESFITFHTLYANKNIPVTNRLASLVEQFSPSSNNTI